MELTLRCKRNAPRTEPPTFLTASTQQTRAKTRTHTQTHPHTHTHTRMRARTNTYTHIPHFTRKYIFKPRLCQTVAPNMWQNTFARARAKPPKHTLRTKASLHSCMHMQVHTHMHTHKERNARKCMGTLTWDEHALRFLASICMAASLCGCHKLWLPHTSTKCRCLTTRDPGGRLTRVKLLHQIIVASLHDTSHQT